MGKRLVAISCLMLLFLVACGGDDGNSVSADDKPISEESSSSSSSVKSKFSSSVEKTLSSSYVVVSSSSVTESSSSIVTPQSSSCLTSVFSSSKDPEPAEGVSSSFEQNIESSSSSADVLSSSSETESSSSSREGKVNCTALLENETGWSWDVPKECRFNPDIDYGTMTDERDGKVYKTVKIGNQVWMAENLNYYDASDLSVKEKSWCFGKKDNGDSTTCDVAGRFYTWAAAIDSVKLAADADNPLDCGYDKICTLPDTVYGICPPGWHLPDTTEWYTLFTVVGGRPTAGMALKSRNGWNDDDGVNGNGSDAFGFSALPIGERDGNGYFDLDGRYTTFWSASQYDRVVASYITLGAYERAYLYESWKYFAKSVRCIKD